MFFKMLKNDDELLVLRNDRRIVNYNGTSDFRNLTSFFCSLKFKKKKKNFI